MSTSRSTGSSAAPRRSRSGRCASAGRSMGRGFGAHAASFVFTSDRFDHTSELPPEANAGNRFYGRDVAEYICDGLAARGLDASFLDEDWGWQVHGAHADGSVLEVSIYHEDGDEWQLMLRLLRRERKLGITRFRESELDE